MKHHLFRGVIGWLRGCGWGGMGVVLGEDAGGKSCVQSSLMDLVSLAVNVPI